MAWTRSMTRNQTCRTWSDLIHDLLLLVMMQLGFGDYFSFRGVCKSWRLLAHSNKSKFMASIPPMSITISSDSNEKACYFEDFEGRKFKTTLPDFSGGDCIGLTCGYLVFFTGKTHDFWLMNPVTNKQLHFPDFPSDHHPGLANRAILVFSPAVSGWVFVVIYGGELWFSIEGKGAWKHVPYTFHIIDLYAFKGKLYTLGYNSSHTVADERRRVCELRLNPEPKFTLLETNNPLFYLEEFIDLGKNIYLTTLVKLYRDRIRRVKLCEKSQNTLKEYALFRSKLNDVGVTVKRESWADPRSRSNGRLTDTDNNRKSSFITENMWYFPHQCMDVDRIDE